jgi:hypothetical protein
LLDDYIEILSGSKIYLKNDKLHRIDGPAMEEPDGENFWWYEGLFIPALSQEEFEKALNMDLEKLEDFLK